MKILLCAATEMEIAPTIQFLSKQEINGIDVLVTGVGLMAATCSLAKAVALHRPDLLLQAGVAGTLNEALPLATVVAVQREAVGDAGVQEGGEFRSLFDLKLLSPTLHPWTDGCLCNGNEILKRCGLPLVNGVTVNEISTGAERIAYYRNTLSAQVESMEGAALHYVGLLEEVPFLQLRSVSNLIGERAKENWKMKEAITNLNREMQRIIKTVTA